MFKLIRLSNHKPQRRKELEGSGLKIGLWDIMLYSQSFLGHGILVGVGVAIYFKVPRGAQSINTKKVSRSAQARHKTREREREKKKNNKNDNCNVNQ